MSLVYLASPYTPTRGESIQSRVDAACKAAAKLMAEGNAVFAPVPHSHYIADHLDDGLRLDHEFWMHQDLEVLQHCDRVVVLRLEGWERSKGIAREMTEAAMRGIPVEFIDP